VKILFLDESGDHNLTSVCSDYPVFVLGGVIVESDYATGEMDRQVKRFKRELFGAEGIILHTADITRSLGAFHRMRNPEFRRRFYAELNTLVDRLKFRVIACAIKKDRHLETYGLHAVDPYILSLGTLVERFCRQLGRDEKGLIVAERRDATLDRQIELAFLNLKIGGANRVPAREIDRKIESLTLRDKRDNISGLQIADLVVTPIGREVLGKPQQPDMKIIDRKFVRSTHGEKLGFGLVILPK